MTTIARRLAQTRGLVIVAAVLLATGSAGAAPAAEPAAPRVVLYDQTNHATAGNDYVTSTKYGAGFSHWDQQAADDFQVPAAKIWTITSVTTPGQYDGVGGAIATAVLVQFYANGTGNVPGNLLRSQNTPGDQVGGQATGTFVINLNPALTLGPGTYWVSVQASMETSNSRQWGWYERTQQSGSESTWRQPSDFQGTTCSTFKPRVTVCNVPNGTTDPDLLFKLEGTALDIVSQTRLPLIMR